MPFMCFPKRAVLTSATASTAGKRKAALQIDCRMQEAGKEFPANACTLPISLPKESLLSIG